MAGGSVLCLARYGSDEQAGQSGYDDHPFRRKDPSPRHDVNVKSFIDLSSKFEFNQVFRYVSALPAQQVTAYATADVRLAWHPDRRFEFAVTGENLLQPHHAEYGGDPGPLLG